MRTGYLPLARWLVPAFTSMVLLGCSPAPKAPLTRDVEVSITFAWTGSQQQRPPDVEVGAVPFEKAKEPLKIAIIRRDATVNEAWKEKQKRETEIEKLRGEIAAKGIGEAPPVRSSTGGQLKKDVEACRDTLNNLADTAVLYLEDVKQKLAAGIEKDRVERFRKNLGAEELRDLALAIKAENTAQVRKALGDAREILGREVWAGKAEDKERGMRAISEVERRLAGAASPRLATGAVPKVDGDLRERIITVVRDQAAWDNRLNMANRAIHMYTALGEPAVRAKTDGQGKCHLTLPREGRWVLFAYVERPFPAGMSEKEQSLRIGEKEEMVWILAAPGDGSEYTSVTFSENNALHPGVAPLAFDAKGE